MSSQALPLSRSRPTTPSASTEVTNPTFIAGVRSDAMRLTRRTFLGSGALLVAGLTLLVTVITFIGASDTAEGDGFQLMSSQLEAARGLIATIESSVNLLGIVLISLGAIAVATDYTTGLIRLLVQAEPRRWRLILGKLVALAGFTVGAAALATVVGLASSPIMAGFSDISTAAWTDGVIGTVASTFLNVALGLFVWTTMGFTIAVVTRSTAAAIAGGIGYIVIFENLLGLVSETLVSWLPGSAIMALVAGGNETRSYGAAVALSAGYALLGLVISLAVFQRRDITA